MTWRCSRHGQAISCDRILDVNMQRGGRHPQGRFSTSRSKLSGTKRGAGSSELVPIRTSTPEDAPAATASSGGGRDDIPVHHHRLERHGVDGDLGRSMMTEHVGPQCFATHPGEGCNVVPHQGEDCELVQQPRAVLFVGTTFGQASAARRAWKFHSEIPRPSRLRLACAPPGGYRLVAAISSRHGRPPVASPHRCARGGRQCGLQLDQFHDLVRLETLDAGIGLDATDVGIHRGQQLSHRAPGALLGRIDQFVGRRPIATVLV